MTIEELETVVKQMQYSLATLTTQIQQITRMHGLLDFNLDDNGSPLKHGDIIQYDNATGKWNNIQPSELNIQSSGGITPTTLKGLTDVSINGEINGHVLTYSSADNAWINKEPQKSTQTDTSKYLTLDDADKRYFKIVGGEITGPVSILGTLHTTDSITSEQAITAKATA